MKFLFNILNSSQVEGFKPHEIALIQTKSNLAYFSAIKSREDTVKECSHCSPIYIETIANLSNSRSD